LANGASYQGAIVANDEAGFGTTIKCPGCGEAIPISEAIHHQIAERTRQEFKAEALEAKRLLAARERELDEKGGRFRSDDFRPACCGTSQSIVGNERRSYIVTRPIQRAGRDVTIL
jgi:hypothetical protein